MQEPKCTVSMYAVRNASGMIQSCGCQCRCSEGDVDVCVSVSALCAEVKHRRSGNENWKSTYEQTTQYGGGGSGFP